MSDPMQAAVDHLMACHGVTEDEAREAITEAMQTDDEFGRLQEFAKSISDASEGEARRMSARGIETPTPSIRFTFKGK